MKTTYLLPALLVASFTLTDGLSQQPHFILQSGHNRAIKWMQYTPDGQYLLTADGRTIRTWETTSYKLLSVKNLVESRTPDQSYNPRLMSGNYGNIPPPLSRRKTFVLFCRRWQDDRRCAPKWTDIRQHGQKTSRLPRTGRHGSTGSDIFQPYTIFCAAS